MSRRTIMHSLAVLMTVVLPVTQVSAGFFRQRAVGGVSIDAEGVLREPDAATARKLAERMKEMVDRPAAELNRPTGLRMVSLRGIQEAIRDARKDGTDTSALPDEIRFLGGLQRIEYVFVYPEQGDIVLAGPGEGWTVDKAGNVVGVTTGRPVMQIDDLLTAFRSVNAARQGHGISCSIDPTADGRVNFQRYMSSISTIRQFNKSAAEKALGAQRITLTGVPSDSHYARVMVAADYRMKRYAMNLEKAPIKGLPSFVDMLAAKRGKLTNAMPRWWLACNYDGVTHSEDGLAWQIHGPGVKVMTEDDFVAADGGVSGSGETNPIAQAWADLMTEKYDELSSADPVFGELRNIMDLSVVAALIKKHDLASQANCDLSLITHANDQLTIETWHAPKEVATQCSLMKVGRETIITASGGVQVESWEVANRATMDNEVKKAYNQAGGTQRTSWRWQ